ncbi:MAG: hydrogenase accessory protein HypB, partial [Woeseiaceae bacterium]
YPVMFRAADLVHVRKSELLPDLEEFDTSYSEDCLRRLASAAPLIEVSARTGDGMDAWLDWLRARLGEMRTREAAVGAG